MINDTECTDHKVISEKKIIHFTPNSIALNIQDMTQIFLGGLRPHIPKIELALKEICD